MSALERQQATPQGDGRSQPTGQAGEAGAEIHAVPDPRRSDRPAFYTATETAKLLRIDESTFYRRLRSGAFPALKIGGRYVIPAPVIERLIADVITTGRRLDVDEWNDQWNESTPNGSSPASAVNWL